MPGTSGPRHDEMHHVEWPRLFVDRTEQRAAIDTLLHRLASNFDTPDFPILQFYGVSGQGKSALCLHTMDFASDRYPNIRFAFTDLDQMDSTRVSKPIEVLWQIVDALAAAQVVAPLTLCLYVHYRRKLVPGEELRPSHIFREGLIERCIRGFEVLSPFKDPLHSLADIGQAAFKTLAIIEDLWVKAVERYREQKIGNLSGSPPSKWDLDTIEKSFPEYLALDIFSHLRSHPAHRVCLVMDTFERLDPNAGDGSSERAFQDLCSRLINAPGDLAGRSAMLLFGRERLRWERYDESRTEPWSEYIRTQELTGFTKTDATAFLHNEYSEFWKRRGVGEIPNMLRKYEPQILEAAEERHGRPGAPTFLPYSLRLAGEMIYVQGDRFAPEMLGQSPEELQRRFLKYLKERYPEKIRAMRVLALALYFDDDLFRYLVRHHLIQGIPIQGFVSELMRDHCYVRRFEDAGKISYRFHRHMQQSLLDGLQREQEDVDAAVEAIDAILDYYSARATFANAHEFVSEIHVPPFEHGMDVLLTHTERGWIHPDRAREWLDRFDRPFDCGDFRIGAVAKMQLLDRVLPLWEKLFGSGSEETADILNHLAILFYGQQRYQEAKSLYERALAIYEKTLPPNNASTATVLRNLAVLYVDEDRPAKALPMLERALEIYEKTFGPEHPNTAGILDSLGVLWAKEWDFLRAREFFERALDIFEKTLEPDNPNIAATRYNISNLTRMEDLFFEE